MNELQSPVQSLSKQVESTMSAPVWVLLPQILDLEDNHGHGEYTRATRDICMRTRVVSHIDALKADATRARRDDAEAALALGARGLGMMSPCSITSIVGDLAAWFTTFGEFKALHKLRVILRVRLDHATEDFETTRTLCAMVTAMGASMNIHWLSEESSAGTRLPMLGETPTPPKPKPRVRWAVAPPRTPPRMSAVTAEEEKALEAATPAFAAVDDDDDAAVRAAMEFMAVEDLTWGSEDGHVRAHAAADAADMGFRPDVVVARLVDSCVQRALDHTIRREDADLIEQHKLELTTVDGDVLT